MQCAKYGVAAQRLIHPALDENGDCNRLQRLASLSFLKYEFCLTSITAQPA